MSAPYQPAWVNPPGQGMNGLAEDFTVTRLSPTGAFVPRAVNDPATKGFYNSDNPSASLNQLIRREDYPPGPEGDAQYEAAVTNFLSGGTQNIANRTPTQQAVWDAQQASGAGIQGGSSLLALQSWATNHPEEALNALIAVNPGTGEAFLDDDSIRQIVAGLGGLAAVNQMIADRRGEMIASGQIPTEYGGQFANEGVEFTDIGNGHYAGSDGKVYVRDDNGNLVPAPTTPQGPPAPGPGQVPGQAGPALQPGDTFQVDPNAPAGPPVQGVTTSPGGFTDHDAGWIAGVEDTPTPVPPTAMGTHPGPSPRQQTPTPYQMTTNGEVVGGQPIDGGYQYSQVGQDVYLDVTDPASGQVHRFTGDVVEAAYSSAGVSSFDEMVARYGYGTAVDMLFSFIAPPPPPQRQPAAPAPAPTGGGNPYTPGGGPIAPAPGGGGGAGGGGGGGPAFTP